jgi:hypothetical protein
VAASVAEVSDILGNNTPLLVAVTSSMALGAGVIVPMPTWAVAFVRTIKQKRVVRREIFFISYVCKNEKLAFPVLRNYANE